QDTQPCDWLHCPWSALCAGSCRPRPPLCQLAKSPPSIRSPAGMKVLLVGSQLHIRRKHSGEHPCALLLCFCCRGWLFSHAEVHNVSASPAPDRANIRTSEVRYLKTRRGETALQVEGGRASADRRQVQHGFEPTTSSSVKGVSGPSLVCALYPAWCAVVSLLPVVFVPPTSFSPWRVSSSAPRRCPLPHSPLAHTTPSYLLGNNRSQLLPLT
ncbi:hypothetical protein JZ751_013706, partial [Albula glossodonta]